MLHLSYNIAQGKVYECTNPRTLEMECEVDEMDAEQTWPTEQDFAEAEEAKKLAKRVPKGNISNLLFLSYLLLLKIMSTWRGGDIITEYSI